MLKSLKIFFKAEGTRPFAVLLCLLLAGVAEATSISALLPTVASIAGGGSSGSSPLGGVITSLMNAVGLPSTLGYLVLVVVSFTVLKALLSFTALSYAGIAAARVAISLRRRLIAAVFDARWGFFAEQKGGHFANVISNDAGRAGDAYLLSAQVVAYSVQAVAYAAVALAINWRLALMGLAASIVIALVLRHLIRLTKRAGYKQTDRTAALTVHMVDMLANIKPLKSMHRHGAMLADITRILNRLKRALITRELTKAGLVQGGDALVAITAGIGLYIASRYTQLTLPELVVSGVIFFQIISIVSKLQRYLQQSAQVESAYIRSDQLIRLANDNHEANPGKHVPVIANGCRFEHVSFAHGTAPVITDATFEIPANAITVFSGPSGAGKTTIIDLLIGLHRPDHGRILVGGTPLEEVDLHAWRRMIGYVPQELSLFHASIRENITLEDASIDDAAVAAAIAQAGAADFVADLPQGQDTDVGEMGSKFSGGQRQRISLARALVTRPQVLILDEVTSALDPDTEHEIVDNIARLRGAYTIIAITHRPAWTRVADRLYNVSRGKVALASSPAETVRAK
jgi:ATP-binding cassette subfamily C protein